MTQIIKPTNCCLGCFGHRLTEVAFQSLWGDLETAKEISKNMVDFLLKEGIIEDGQAEGSVRNVGLSLSDED